MGKTSQTVTEYTCDRCGSTENTTFSQGRQEWGGMDIGFRGVTGSRTWDGAGAENRHEGRGWLCLNCTKDFLKFIDNQL